MLKKLFIAIAFAVSLATSGLACPGKPCNKVRIKMPCKTILKQHALQAFKEFITASIASHAIIECGSDMVVTIPDRQTAIMYDIIVKKTRHLIDYFADECTTAPTVEFQISRNFNNYLTIAGSYSVSQELAEHSCRVYTPLLLKALLKTHPNEYSFLIKNGPCLWMYASCKPSPSLPNQYDLLIKNGPCLWVYASCESSPSLPIKESAVPAKQPSLPAKELALPAKEPSLPTKVASPPVKEPALPAKEIFLPEKKETSSCGYYCDIL